MKKKSLTQNDVVSLKEDDYDELGEWTDDDDVRDILFTHIEMMSEVRTNPLRITLRDLQCFEVDTAKRLNEIRRVIKKFKRKYLTKKK